MRDVETKRSFCGKALVSNEISYILLCFLVKIVLYGELKMWI